MCLKGLTNYGDTMKTITKYFKTPEQAMTWASIHHIKNVKKIYNELHKKGVTNQNGYIFKLNTYNLPIGEM